jgi:hypothetical protein
VVVRVLGITGRQLELDTATTTTHNGTNGTSGPIAKQVDAQPTDEERVLELSANELFCALLGLAGWAAIHLVVHRTIFSTFNYAETLNYVHIMLI